MAAGDKFFGYKPHPNELSQACNNMGYNRYTSDTARDIPNTQLMEDGLYEFTLSCMNTYSSTGNYWIYLDLGSDVWSDIVMSTTATQRQQQHWKWIFRVDKGKGSYITIRAGSSAFFGSHYTWKWIGE